VYLQKRHITFALQLQSKVLGTAIIIQNNWLAFQRLFGQAKMENFAGLLLLWKCRMLVAQCWESSCLVGAILAGSVGIT
jgi:hypothetical protein